MIFLTGFATADSGCDPSPNCTQCDSKCIKLCGNVCTTMDNIAEYACVLNNGTAETKCACQDTSRCHMLTDCGDYCYRLCEGKFCYDYDWAISYFRPFGEGNQNAYCSCGNR